MSKERFRRSYTGMVCAVIALLCFSSSAKGQNSVLTFTFDFKEFRIENRGLYELISFGDLDHFGEIGHPLLPVKIVHVHNPPGKRIEEVIIRNRITRDIPGIFKVLPAQPQQIISNPTARFVDPDPRIYTSADPYPVSVIQPASEGFLAGYPVGSLVIYPVQYNPSKNGLIFTERLDVEIRYTESSGIIREAGSSPLSGTSQTSMLEALTAAGIEDAVPFHAIRTSSVLPAVSHPYIIITTENMADAFGVLADWKTKKGLMAKLVTKEWIDGAYTGLDIQQKIRRFIRDAQLTWNTEWVLLGGDTHAIPDRKAYAMDCEYGSFTDNYIPCDLYYADLDGDWNANGNDLYGEVDDGVDLYPDVFVGRAAVDDSQEANAWIQKLLAYEKYQGAAHAKSILFIAGIEWNDPYTNSGDMKDFIDEMYVPDRFDPITKMYSAEGNDDMGSVLAALNTGQNIVNHSNHAWYTGVSLGHQLLGIPEIDGLNNGTQGGMFYSTGCWPAAFDYDCFAEHFLTNPNGGGVAFVGNSRYGWGSPGNPLYGYSDRFDQMFFKTLFIDGLSHIGQTLATAKSRFIPFSGQENVYRWHQYQVNLLGDPEMSLWTDEPAQLSVFYPDSLPSTGGSLIVTVTGSGPVESAQVCIMQDTTVYHVGRTGQNGQIEFTISGAKPTAPIHLTVTAQNYIPFESSIIVQAEGPYVQIDAHPSEGAEEYFVKPDTEETLSIWIKNIGTDTAENVEVQLSSEHPSVVMIDSMATFTRILPGDSVHSEGSFVFHVAQGMVNGEIFYVRWDVHDADGNLWQNRTAFTCITPILACVSSAATDSISNDTDGFVDPGEDIVFKVGIQNAGLDSAHSVSMTFSSGDATVEFIESEVVLGTMAPGQTVNVDAAARISDSCTSPGFPSVNIALNTQNGYRFDDSMNLTVGRVVFTDNIEQVSDNWTHSGSPDLWHISTVRQHSGDHSWSCSRIGEYHYDNQMANNTLTLKPHIIGRNAQLSFWAWYEFPNYGTTGFYVEVHDGIQWKVLDFIGSGGALGFLPTGMEWYEYMYDLSSITPGTSVQVRFRFQSDEENVTEGVYIDDVIIEDENADLYLKALPRPSSPAFSISENGNDVLLTWANDGTVAEIEAFSEDGYTFQGYKVYQLPTNQPSTDGGICVATFDLVDGVTEIEGGLIDPVSGMMQDTVRHEGTDSGLEYSVRIDADLLEDLYFIQGKSYHYAVTAYAYHPDTTVHPQSSESLIKVSSVVYHQGYPGPSFGDTLTVSQVSGWGDAAISPVIVDPNIFTGHTYRLEFTAIQSDALSWSLIDLNANQTVLSDRSMNGTTENAPVVDGFQLFVQEPDTLDFISCTVSGQGNYELSSHYAYHWSPTARAVDTYGTGIVDRSILSQDYELRFTGEYESATSNLRQILEGTGSMATLVDARYYSIANHPLNPYPGSEAPFSVRIPFEVWNTDQNRQVNLIIYDRAQQLSDTPFYAFNPDERMYCWILNTPYHATPVDWSINEQSSLTWNLDFWKNQFVNGDVIEITYASLMSTSDVYTFSTDTESGSGGELIDTTYDLLQNYPNPFNAQTTIRFRIVERQPVILTIYNLLGEVVREFHVVENQLVVEWDGQDFDGRLLSSGVYFCRMKAGDFQKVRKMILLR